MSIKIQVAKCTDCNGYYSSAPLENKDIFNPEITDHYFYHGEPWFTLDLNAFEKFKKYERTEIKIVELDEHRKQDHLHCHCPKKKTVSKRNTLTAHPRSSTLFLRSKSMMPIRIFTLRIFITPTIISTE